MSGINEQLKLTNTEIFSHLVDECKQFLSLVRDLRLEKASPKDIYVLCHGSIKGDMSFREMVRRIVLGYLEENGERE